MGLSGLTETEVAALADFLANMHDLPSPDLAAEFRVTMSASFPTIETEYLDFVFYEFEKLSAATRFDVYFDHCGFVRASFASFSIGRKV